MGSNSIKAQSETDFKEAWEYCEKYTRSVEILYTNENNQKTLANVHFRFNSKVIYVRSPDDYNNLRFVF